MPQAFAMVFPGQGSQHRGMLSELARETSQVKNTFDEASAVLSYDLWEIVQENPDGKLDETEYTQPALLAADVAVFRAWRDEGGQMPALMAGHSLGEYSALVCADALAFTDAIKLVADRGRFMQAAVPMGVGAMGAIVGLNEDQVENICKKAQEGEVVSPANFNSIGQTVIAGHKNAVLRALALAEKENARMAKILPVSVPSHCILMQPAAERMRVLLESITFKNPRVPIIHNADLKNHDTPQAIRRALVDQLVSPVRWVETVLNMIAQGIRFFIECGPDRKLAGLIRRIDSEVPTYSLHNHEQIRAALNHAK